MQLITLILLLLAYACKTPEQGSEEENEKQSADYSHYTRYARDIMTRMAAEDMHGRAAEHDGEEKAARYLAEEYGKLPLKRFNDSVFQLFTIKGRNSQPYDHYLAIDGKELSDNGMEYIVVPWSGSDSGTYPLLWIDSAAIDNYEGWKALKNKDLSNFFIVVDYRGHTSKPEYSVGEHRDQNPLKARGVIELIPEGDRLNSAASGTQNSFVSLRIRESLLPKTADSISLDIKTKYHENYTSRNIIRYTEGQTDSFIVFTAHYDHLGQMGKNAYFSGFMDNASGSALILALAKYFSERPSPPPYSLAFIALGAEETGTQGAAHYVKHPLFPLDKIKVLFNFDMVASGDTSMKVSYATTYPGEYARFDQINKEKQYFDTLLYLPPNAASDHRVFDAAGVKSMFIQAIEQPYKFHTVMDKPETYAMENFSGIFCIMKDYVESYEQ